MERLSENHWYLNRTELTQGTGTRWATIVIAASDSTTAWSTTATSVWCRERGIDHQRGDRTADLDSHVVSSTRADRAARGNVPRSVRRQSARRVWVDARSTFKGWAAPGARTPSARPESRRRRQRSRSQAQALVAARRCTSPTCKSRQGTTRPQRSHCRTSRRSSTVAR